MNEIRYSTLATINRSVARLLNQIADLKEKPAQGYEDYETHLDLLQLEKDLSAVKDRLVNKLINA